MHSVHSVHVWYLVVGVHLGHGEGPEAVGDGVLVGVHLVPELVGVDGRHHADEVLEQSRALVLRDDALNCRKSREMQGTRDNKNTEQYTTHQIQTTSTRYLWCANKNKLTASSYLCLVGWQAWTDKGRQTKSSGSCETR